jgi:hypothetical protein
MVDQRGRNTVDVEDPADSDLLVSVGHGRGEPKRTRPGQQLPKRMAQSTTTTRCDG